MQTILIRVSGKVQGVFFRQGTREKARELGITGTVCNLADGRVEIVATGMETQLQQLTAWCKQGPPKAKVSNVQWEKIDVQLFQEFNVLR